MHFDSEWPLWWKLGVVVVAVVLAILFLDQPIAHWTWSHPISDLARSTGGETRYQSSDIGRELMWLEQWGQGICSVVVIMAVGLLDRAGRRRALALAIGCLCTVLATHLLKDLCGRSRPFVAAPDGSWMWGGPRMGFKGGARWTSFPSAHTTAAFALSAGLSWFYPRGRLFFMALALTTATLRVLHTAHYLSDVIAGMAIGVMVMRTTLRAKLAGWSIALSLPKPREWWLKDNWS